MANQMTIAMITIGQTPRDDVVPAMRRVLPDWLEIREYGALDGMERDEIDAFTAVGGEAGIVTRLQDGSSVLLSHERIVPRMQEQVDRAVGQDGAGLVVVLCGADWNRLQSTKLIVNPGQLFPAIITALARGRRLGIIKPDVSQVERERTRYAERGIDAVVTSASPYAGPDRLTLAGEAAAQLRESGCELIWMTCVGMDEAMRTVVAGETGAPVILAQSLLARIVTEMLPIGAGVGVPTH